jgi:predicted enzyme related to lactoylglutathione lyase
MSKFIWYDLMTRDAAASNSFYAHVVGWNVETDATSGPNYNILKAGAESVGGIMAMPPDSGPSMPPFWSGYIYSADVDATAKKVAKLGGQVCREPVTIPGIIRFAVLADMHGAFFNVMTPLMEGQASTTDDRKPGQIGWRELMSGNWKEAWDFYEGLFGWKKSEAMDIGPMGTYQLFDTGPGQAGGMMTKTAEDPAPPHWNYYFSVDAMTGAIARAKSKGATFFMEPIEVPGGGFATNGMDPQGAAFSLFSSVK